VVSGPTPCVRGLSFPESAFPESGLIAATPCGRVLAS